MNTIMYSRIGIKMSRGWFWVWVRSITDWDSKPKLVVEIHFFFFGTLAKGVGTQKRAAHTQGKMAPLTRRRKHVRASEEEARICGKRRRSQSSNLGQVSENHCSLPLWSGAVLIDLIFLKQ